MTDQRQVESLNRGKAEYVRLFSHQGQIEISKFDKEARQDYALMIPEREYNRYANEGVPIEKALPGLSEEQREFLHSHLTPGEQRIVRDPVYQEALRSLKKAPLGAIAAERAAILDRANGSQLEPYDYHLSVRHQAFNAALHQRPDVNQAIKEIDWVKDVSQAQYRSQLNRDSSFNPEMRLSPEPGWVSEQQKGSERRFSPAPAASRASVPTRLAPSLASTHQPLHPRSPEPHPEINQVTPSLGPTDTHAFDARSDAEAFKSAERITSAMFGECAKTIAAQTGSGIYRGPIVAETSDLVLQRLSARAVVAHPKKLFDEGLPLQVGDNISISYSNSKPLVRELKEPEKTMTIGR